MLIRSIFLQAKQVDLAPRSFAGSPRDRLVASLDLAMIFPELARSYKILQDLQTGDE